MPKLPNDKKMKNRSEKKEREKALRDLIKNPGPILSQAELSKDTPAHYSKGAGDPNKQLSPNEIQFVYEMTRSDPHKPRNATIAYMRAYGHQIPDSGPLPQGMAHTASNLRRKARIQRAINASLAELRRETQQKNRHMHALIRERLWEEGNNPDNPASSRVNALKSLADMIGPEDPELEVKENAANLEDMKQELIAALENSTVQEAIEVESGVEVEMNPTKDIDVEVVKSGD